MKTVNKFYHLIENFFRYNLVQKFSTRVILVELLTSRKYPSLEVTLIYSTHLSNFHLAVTSCEFKRLHTDYSEHIHLREDRQDIILMSQIEHRFCMSSKLGNPVHLEILMTLL